MKVKETKTLYTERLILRKINSEDYKQAYKNWCSDIDVCKYTTWDIHQNELFTKELFDRWISEYQNDETYRWIIELKDEKKVIGTIDSTNTFSKYKTYEIGYCLSKDYWNKGIMTEALKRVIKFFFEEVEAETIYATHMHNNKASGKVMQKSGMKYEATLRSRVVDKTGLRNDLDYYSIIKEEYFSNKAN